MPILRLDHVQLAMPAGGEDAARAFYHGALGIAETPKPADMAKRGGCWFEEGAVKIHLGVDPDFRPARKAHPGLLVTDLATLKERLSAGNYAYQENDSLPGYRRIFVDDPFGNRLELIEPLGS